MASASARILSARQARSDQSSCTGEDHKKRGSAAAVAFALDRLCEMLLCSNLYDYTDASNVADLRVHTASDGGIPERMPVESRSASRNGCFAPTGRPSQADQQEGGVYYWGGIGASVLVIVITLQLP